MSLLDLIGKNPADPGMGGVDLKQFLAPVMQAYAKQAQEANDPLNKISDIGGAIFDTISTGQPYGRNIAALEEKRKSAVQGAAQMFLNLLGQERQVEELKAQDRRHQESMSLQRDKMALDMAQFKVTSGQTDRRITFEEGREERRDRDEVARREKERRLDERKGYDEIERVARTSLPDEQKQALQRRLSEDKEYQQFVADGRYREAGARLQQHFLALAPQYPKEVMKQVEGFGTLHSSMARMRDLFKESSWGSRMVDPETRTRFQTVHAQALNAVRALGEMGVLTPGEIPFAERFLPSPTQWSVRGRDSILAGFDELDRFITAAIDRAAAKTGIPANKIRDLAKIPYRSASDMPPPVESRGPGYEIQKPTLRFNPKTGKIESVSP